MPNVIQVAAAAHERGSNPLPLTRCSVCRLCTRGMKAMVPQHSMKPNLLRTVRGITSFGGDVGPVNSNIGGREVARHFKK